MLPLSVPIASNSRLAMSSSPFRLRFFGEAYLNQDQKLSQLKHIHNHHGQQEETHIEVLLRRCPRQAGASGGKMGTRGVLSLQLAIANIPKLQPSGRRGIGKIVTLLTESTWTRTTRHSKALQEVVQCRNENKNTPTTRLRNRESSKAGNTCFE